MKNNSELKLKAINLRSQGKSYGEISKELSVAKSTLSNWLKSIKLKPEYIKRLYTKQVKILSRGPQSQKERRAKQVKQIIDQAKNDVKFPISDEVLKFFGVGLYWAEGSKGNSIQITNSDPQFILFFVKWLEKIFKIKPEGLKVNLNIYKQQDETKIRKFWSDLTGIPQSNFGKLFIKPFSSGFKANNLYYGTARIYVPKSADMKYKMLGWLEALLQEYNSDVKLTKEKWVILKKTKRPINLKI